MLWRITHVQLPTERQHRIYNNKLDGIILITGGKAPESQKPQTRSNSCHDQHQPPPVPPHCTYGSDVLRPFTYRNTLWVLLSFPCSFPPALLPCLKPLIICTALREALITLGYHSTYHYSSCAIENPRDCEMWIDAFKAKFEHNGTFGKEQWDQLLGHCMVYHAPPPSLRKTQRTHDRFRQ